MFEREGGVSRSPCQKDHSFPASDRHYELEGQRKGTEIALLVILPSTISCGSSKETSLHCYYVRMCMNR